MTVPDRIKSVLAGFSDDLGLKGPNVASETQLKASRTNFLFILIHYYFEIWDRTGPDLSVGPYVTNKNEEPKKVNTERHSVLQRQPHFPSPDQIDF